MSRWLRRLGTTAGPVSRLFCFHSAGGAASAYQGWAEPLSDGVEVVAVQLPGRENRFTEPPHDRMAPLVEELTEVLEPLLDLPFAFFGHSMGARVAFCLAHALGDAGPGRLFVAGSPAPSLRVPVPAWNGSDAGLARYLADLGGTPPQVLADPELLSLLLPTLRADLTVVATWDHPDPAPLACDLHALSGRLDPYAPPARMAAWARETSATFTLDPLPGGHFFVRTELSPVLDIVRRAMANLAERGAHAAR
ncbi:hypothetical protein BLA60_18885 [Actinophytocola xinjiangensis]|uniref:Thioesterase domain-containing protein n=1 Tax=Actinophytocola xinjiangensis TaxID=485602 RepID=A0A7Z1AZ00_9PSEU|nr:alpha/beta fold hydrolase [Actinophytocola xinjiangensis]OLF09833.1 hypothetical protein BLA60_18885 [Actinophytocola xinjiangensis]